MTRPADLLVRFTRGERWVHRWTAALMGVCLATAAILYIGQLSVLVGRRALVEDVHVVAGIALPVPILLGWLSAAFRADARRLNRFRPSDWAWLRSRGWRGSSLPVGKFNAGQKLNASFTAGAILVLVGTGLIMRFANHWPLSLRTGATFVHDWLTFAVSGVLLGHIMFALRDPHARAGMRTGVVPAYWAADQHSEWAQEYPGQGSLPSQK
ncbi:MAG: cytochrome b/b6 domain-containing protein [Actinomycetota bacterium]|nr:cytochrome b/b6 domain-containing protein [Actinomycetota bacterium]